MDSLSPFSPRELRRAPFQYPKYDLERQKEPYLLSGDNSSLSEDILPLSSLVGVLAIATTNSPLSSPYVVELPKNAIGSKKKE